MIRPSTRRAGVIAGGALLAVSATAIAAAVALDGPDSPAGTDRQNEVAARGADVMPFDLETTTHRFTDTTTGGRQTVIADDPDDDAEVAAIREHLQEEAEAFQAGDFSDPASIHGEDMPGLVPWRRAATRSKSATSNSPTVPPSTSSAATPLSSEQCTTGSTRRSTTTATTPNTRAEPGAVTHQRQALVTWPGPVPACHFGPARMSSAATANARALKLCSGNAALPIAASNAAGHNS